MNIDIIIGAFTAAVVLTVIGIAENHTGRAHCEAYTGVECVELWVPVGSTQR